MRTNEECMVSLAEHPERWTIREPWWRGQTPSAAEVWLHQKRESETRSIVQRWVDAGWISPMHLEEVASDIMFAFYRGLRDAK